MNSPPIPTNVQELLYAAQFLTSPGMVSARERQFAEEVFRLFKSSSSVELAKQALDTSTNGYVIFQAIQALTANVIRNWQHIKLTAAQICDYFAELLLVRFNSNDASLGYIRRQLCRSIGIICKKSTCSLVGGNQSQTGLVEQLLLRRCCADGLKPGIEFPVQQLYARIVLAVLEEIQSSRSCREVACGVKAHLTGKKAFQRQVLPKLFEFILPLFHSSAAAYLTENNNNAAAAANFMLLYSELLEACFTWDFRLSISSADDQQQSAQSAAATPHLKPPVFSPPYEFARLLFAKKSRLVDSSNDVLTFLFQLYILILQRRRRQKQSGAAAGEDVDANLANKIGSCLIQMASLSGETLFGSNDADHLTNFIKCLTSNDATVMYRFNAHDVTNDEITIASMDTIATIFSNLILYTNQSTFDKVDNNYIEQFLLVLSQITIQCGLCSLYEREDLHDAIGQTMLSARAYADLLETWQSILCMYNTGIITLVPPLADEADAENAADKKPSLLEQQSLQLLQCFIHIHLSPPFGARRDEEQHYIDAEVDEEQEEGDAERFCQQLQVAGAWARACWSQALPMLVQLLERVQLKFEQQQSTNPLTTENLIYTLNEDLTWMLMIASHCVFAEMPCGGSSSMTDDSAELLDIPQSIISHSEQQKSVDVDATSTFLVQSLDDAASSSSDAASNNIDDFIKLVVHVLRWPRRVVASPNIVAHLSPQIISTYLKFMQYWIRVYVLPSDLHSTLSSSPTLQAVLQKNVECVEVQLEFALRLALVHLSSGAEPDILLNAVMLVKCVCLKLSTSISSSAQFEGRTFLLKSPSLQLIFKHTNDAHITGNVLALRLPKQSLILLYEALTSACVLTISSIREEVKKNSMNFANSFQSNGGSIGWGGGGGGLVSTTPVDTTNSNQQLDIDARQIRSIFHELIRSINERLSLAIVPPERRRGGGGGEQLSRDIEWMLILSSLNAYIGCIRAQVQHGTVDGDNEAAGNSIARYLCESSQHCSHAFDAWCDRYISSNAFTNDTTLVNEVLLNFAPLLFEFYTSMQKELSTSLIAAGDSNDNSAGENNMQNALNRDLHLLTQKWHYLVVNFAAGKADEESQHAFQASFCACCAALQAALTNLTTQNVANSSESHAANFLLESLVLVLDAIKRQQRKQLMILSVPAVSESLFALLNRFLYTMPKQTIMRLLMQRNHSPSKNEAEGELFNDFIYLLQFGIEHFGGISSDTSSNIILVTFQALSNVALEIAYVLGTVRSTCAAMPPGVLMDGANGNISTNSSRDLTLEQKFMLSNCMSKLLLLIFRQLFTGHATASTAGSTGADAAGNGGGDSSGDLCAGMANAVYGLICCCRMPQRGDGGSGDNAATTRFLYQNVMEEALSVISGGGSSNKDDDAVVRQRLAQHCVTLVEFIEHKAVATSAEHGLQFLRVDKKTKAEFRDDIFSPLFTDARMLISISLFNNGQQKTTTATY